MTNNFQTSWDSIRMQANREEMVERLKRAVPENGHAQPLEGLHLFNSTVPHVHLHSLAEPSFCVIAQGSKEIIVGDSVYRYDPFHYLISTVELPRFSQVTDASKERPYLSFRLDFTPAMIDSVLMESGAALPHGDSHVRATDVSRLDADLQDAVLRLIRLIDNPTDAPVFSPLIVREIVLRLLMGKQSARLRHLSLQNGNAPHIAKAVERLRQEFDQPLHIEDLARELGMSVSGLHHQFKAVTELSPLQFQKQIRLQESRRLMLIEGFDAGDAAYRVGYNNTSQFNRDYKNLFGSPPIRDIHRIRGEFAITA